MYLKVNACFCIICERFVCCLRTILFYSSIYCEIFAFKLKLFFLLPHIYLNVSNNTFYIISFGIYTNKFGIVLLLLTCIPVLLEIKIPTRSFCAWNNGCTCTISFPQRLCAVYLHENIQPLLSRPTHFSHAGLARIVLKNL